MWLPITFPSHFKCNLNMCLQCDWQSQLNCGWQMFLQCACIVDKWVHAEYMACFQVHLECTQKQALHSRCTWKQTIYSACTHLSTMQAQCKNICQPQFNCYCQSHCRHMLRLHSKCEGNVIGNHIGCKCWGYMWNVNGMYLVRTLEELSAKACNVPNM